MKLRFAFSFLAVFAGAMPVADAVPLGQRELAFVLTRNPNVENGAALYETCAACHGTKGEGASDGSVPALAGQSYTVLAKQIVDFRVRARVDTRMVHFTDRTHLAFSQPIADVAAYIARLKAPSAKAPAKSPATTRGATVYARSCERCHGALAEGNEDTLTPRLATQHSEYLLKQFDDAAQGQRPALAEAHASLPRDLPRQDLADIASYLSTLAP